MEMKKMKKSFQVNKMLQKMKLILTVMILVLLKIDLSTEKQFTRKRLVHSKDSSLDESNFEPIVYVNRNGNFHRLSWPKDK